MKKFLTVILAIEKCLDGTSWLGRPGAVGAVRALSLLIGVLFIAAFAAPRVHADLLVGSALTNQVLRYDETGAFKDVFASGNGLTFPSGGLTFGPDGNLYVVSNNAGGMVWNVLRFNGISGAFIDIFASGGGLRTGRGLVFGEDKNLYVSSEDTNQVLKYDGNTGAFLSAFSDLTSPRGLTFGPDGDLYVARGNGTEIKRFDGTTGAFIEDFVDSDLDGPFDLTFGPDGNLFVSVEGTNDVRLYDGTNGDFIDSFASGGGLTVPRGVLFGPGGDLYVVSQETDQVLRYNGMSGVFIGAFVLAGDGGLDGPRFMTFSPAPPPSAVPEPSTLLLLLGSGLVGLGRWRRVKKMALHPTPGNAARILR